MQSDALFQGKWGIEREALRIDRNGRISEFGHPERLASPEFERDFAEAQLEIITPALNGPAEVFSALRDQTRLAYRVLSERSAGAAELLWPFSMPVPVADTGAVELGYKNDGVAYLYRKGLASRYGVRSQLISGIHYNFSFSPLLFESLGLVPEDVYFRVIRNLYRSAWALIVLFGASPRRFDSPEFGRPSERNCRAYLHSLRTGPAGYGALNPELPKMRYGGYGEYRSFVDRSVSTRSRQFGKLYDGIDQLNGNIAQKESEVYLPFRYRQSSNGPYLEIRLFDVDPFVPWGIDERGIRLVHLFIIKALLDDSPAFTGSEWKKAQKKMTRASLCSRSLHGSGRGGVLKELNELFNAFESISASGRSPEENAAYVLAVAQYRNRARNGFFLSERIESQIQAWKGDALAFGLHQAEMNRQEALADERKPAAM